MRLRITCDNKYPELTRRIFCLIQEIFPKNKVSIVNRGDSCTDISCYSNKLEEILGWKAKEGSKARQAVSIPKWIKESPSYIKPCLRGLIETDGSLYFDKKYLNVNFTTIIPILARDFVLMTKKLGYTSSTYSHTPAKGKTKYTVRVFRKASEFVGKIHAEKS